MSLKKHFGALAAIILGTLVTTGNAQEQLRLQLAERFYTRYVKNSGAVISEGPTVQEQVKLSYGNTQVYFSLNHDLDSEEKPRGLDPNEIVLALSQRVNFDKKDSVNLSLLRGWYPEGTVTPYNELLVEAKFNRKGFFNYDLALRHYFPAGTKPEAQRVIATLSKPMELAKFGKNKIVISPNVWATYHDGHVAEGGIYHFTWGSSLAWERGKHGIELMWQRQHGEESKNRQDITYGYVTIKTEF
jgi:hypothetical protein